MNATPFLPDLSPVQTKPLTAACDGGNLTSNAGTIVLREAANRLGLAEVIAGPLTDTRNPAFVTHSYVDMVTARMMAIAAGYEDGDDLDDLRHDPSLKIALNRAPESGDGLPSQPTISRLENLADERTLFSIAMGLIDLYCRSYRRPPSSIVLDIDDTDDLVHGGQQLSLFNAHTGGYCFKPIKIFEANSGLPILALIRPGKRPTGKEIAVLLRTVIWRIRDNWPDVRILIRGDSHYCAPEVLDILRKLQCDYILGLAINPVLEAHARPWREQCAKRWWPSLGKVRRFHTFSYCAGSWSQAEKVIARVEATAQGSDVRFIVTNLEGRSKHLYEKVYGARGQMENLIKDIKLYTRSDGRPTSSACSCTWAPTGCCTACAWRRRNDPAGAVPRSQPSARRSSRSQRESKKRRACSGCRLQAIYRTPRCCS